MKKMVQPRRKHIIQLVVLAVFISFLTTTVISVHSLDSLIRHNAQSLTNLLSSSIYDAVRNSVLKPSMVARLISGDSFLVNLLRVEQSYSEDYIAFRLQTYLTGIRKSIDFDSAFLVPTDGHHLFGLNAEVRQLDPDNAQDAGYHTFISSGRTYLPVVQADPFCVDRKMFYIFSRIADEEGKVVGMCGVGIPLEKIQGVLDSFERKYNVRIHLIDWDEKSMLSTETSLSGIETVKDLPNAYQKERNFSYAENKHGGYVITRYLNIIGWFLVIRGEETEGNDAFTHLIVGNIVAIVVIFVLLFLAMHFLMRTERTHLENKAFTDELTGIVNRAGFAESLESKLQQDGEEGSLFLLDLDHFKEVNDNLGHPAGDALLKQTALNLKGQVRGSDLLARLGGDEFIVYFSGMCQYEIVAAKAEQIRKALIQRYVLPNGTTLTVSASIGIAICPVHGNTYKTLYQKADKALYSSKEQGRNCFTVLTLN
ncbi:MAG: GGDEF domain-containing protein [Desulfovibrio sp.]|nr:GGDEF domain-containing protein [Desulfovibrio sp.]